MAKLIDKLPKMGKTESGWTRVGWLRVDVNDGHIYPRWYGLAYLNPLMRSGVCYPIPLNWLVWLGMYIYWKLQNPPQYYSNAYQDGWNAALRYKQQEINTKIFSKFREKQNG